MKLIPQRLSSITRSKRRRASCCLLLNSSALVLFQFLPTPAYVNFHHVSRSCAVVHLLPAVGTSATAALASFSMVDARSVALDQGEFLAQLRRSGFGRSFPAPMPASTSPDIDLVRPVSRRAPCGAISTRDCHSVNDRAASCRVHSGATSTSGLFGLVTPRCRGSNIGYARIACGQAFAGLQRESGDTYTARSNSLPGACPLLPMPRPDKKGRSLTTTLTVLVVALKIAREATDDVPLVKQILGSAVHVVELALVAIAHLHAHGY